MLRTWRRVSVALDVPIGVVGAEEEGEDSRRPGPQAVPRHNLAKQQGI